jgi:hypothetical protein
VGGQSLSLHAEGEKMVLTKEDGSREEVELTAPPQAVTDQGGEE